MDRPQRDHETNVLCSLDFSIAASASEWTDHPSRALAATRQIKVGIVWAVDLKLQPRRAVEAGQAGQANQTMRPGV
jgi:hypothetical protein